ncbi:MAG: hypothetical protein V3R47_03285 [candidate division NC10 bacterium]
MEAKRWPPVYDEGYLPDPHERYWFRDRETMDPEERLCPRRQNHNHT